MFVERVRGKGLSVVVGRESVGGLRVCGSRLLNVDSVGRYCHGRALDYGFGQQTVLE